jgi:hypothetical protein
VTIPNAVAVLRSPLTIRERCHRLLHAGLDGRLEHFAIDASKLDAAAQLTARITRERYPELNVPAHSRFAHFDAGGVKRLARLEQQIAERDPRERARALVDVVVTSVLLDAGAGPGWRYRESHTGMVLGRSEGLAVASLAWAEQGGLSSQGRPFEVDARGLRAVDGAALARAFQVTAENPLEGLDGRVHHLRALSAALEERPDVFGADARLGGLVDHLFTRAEGNDLDAARILESVLDAFSGIWPGRISLFGMPLGDVWRHEAAGGDAETAGLLPLHKLSQWLTYSLLEPLQVAGLRVRNIDALAGLAEYRNGGLFVDVGVLVPRHEGVLRDAHEVGSTLIVEWRGLTVALLDELAPRVREVLGTDATRMPLAAVLEGGTWAAGRELARTLRADGSPPIRVISDGTVF